MATETDQRVVLIAVDASDISERAFHCKYIYCNFIARTGEYKIRARTFDAVIKRLFTETEDNNLLWPFDHSLSIVAITN